MSTVLASALPEKPVLSADGRKLGTVHNLTIDPRSGDFETLLVDPDPDAIDPDAIDRGTPSADPTERDAVDRDDGPLRIPGDAVAAVGDQVIVDLSADRSR
ncbi:PRC-barrel domain-containing protein [Halorubrum rubrum]|uniref:PRC-barrel domain-containing protein n=1 Tax=Halorubrum rubrum TaxID=1126240 RepID=A0ABD5R4W0_9EURY|nr:PRC-barrel domain-containing protein [Halorubrum rubrum]